ncbi:hypothetical protein SAMN05192559_101987 [Halobacillus karajensis]|uniref:Uncharacterized protein n=1 Tax=Halobacillus karajensis TaxID=195088 RepID=A0A059NVU4_9BACI|nr:membrane protein [Halobacillus karajensis]CDQ18399.1 hypothetical protein BN982_00669 [Halobacillus karajensis]CDQ23529.1 hypothetical protein BN983_01759 [Halobacillus karajensis]CDQ27011.1 hypothetical protein BN981_01239 [Halobacillus karajensis]SEH51934.1 hypothetical protein SAMN05192559_101987 [Halobacillus karajensis]
MKEKRLEILLWSIAFPGFGQILNGQVIKGLAFIILEIILNVNSSFNMAIIHSFHGNITKAIEVTDYQWLMFYPCVYMFAVWDAYRKADGECESYTFVPFAFCAYFVTVGLIYSPVFKVAGTLIGPVWLPILSLIPGTVIGLLIRRLFMRLSKNPS